VRKRRDPTSPKQKRRTLIRSSSSTYLASSAGRRVIYNCTAQQKPMMMTIRPSPASQVGTASQAGNQRSRILRINSRTWRSPSRNWSQLKRAISDLDSHSSEEMSYFQYGSRINGGGCLSKVLMDMAFKQSKKRLQEFDLRGVVLLDNQSTVDISATKNLSATFD
jgi:hypothetical protein